MPEMGLADHFIGVATVGERGQVVIPAEARGRLQIRPGDKLLVFCHPAGWGVAFVKFEKLKEAEDDLAGVIEKMEEIAKGEHPELPGEEAET